MKKDIDRILKQALAPEEEPDWWLNQNIINRAEEMTQMKLRKKSRVPVAILAASFTLIVGSAAVFAAARYLGPAQIAQELEDTKLMEAFQGKDAVLVNETQEYGGYRVTLLGAVSGKNISQFLSEDNQGQVEENRFYAAVAIEHADGTPMPDTSDSAYGEEEFYVSPYIKGLEPWNYGLMNMSGGYSAFVQDGIQYRLLDMDNIDIFADRGIYIGVSAGTFYDRDAYLFDETTGEITRNEAYDKLNALFILPLDPAKGDREAAEAFLKAMEEEDDTPIESTEEDQVVEDWIEQLEKELQAGEIVSAERVESTVQICKPDADGTISYEYSLENGGGGSGIQSIEFLFPDKKAGTMALAGYSSGENENGLDYAEADIMTLNEDGTVTFAVYMKK